MKKIELLIVDDNANFTDRMKLLLAEVEQLGHISVAANYDEARTLLAMDNPEIVLLDINLPGRNGIDLLRLIRQNNKACEVIMISNHSDNYYKQQCRELGARYFLDKSSDFSQVPGLVRQYCTGIS